MGDLVKYGLLALGGYMLYEYLYGTPVAAGTTVIPPISAGTTQPGTTGSGTTLHLPLLLPLLLALPLLLHNRN